MTNKTEFIVFGAPDIRDAEIQEVTDTLKSGWIGTGPKVKRFEQNFAQYKNVSSDNVVALSSCTAALHLALVAAGIKHGDEVITTANTFCATINSILHAGAIPVLVDIDKDDFNIDVNKIECLINKKTRVILPVHFGGRPCNISKILQLAEKYNLKVIEDCAHAIEAEVNGQKIGTLGDFGCYSFYVNKNYNIRRGVSCSQKQNGCRKY